jgi:hypothetical protein
MSNALKTFSNMKSRCYDPNNNKFSSYGGKGISIYGYAILFLLLHGQKRMVINRACKSTGRTATRGIFPTTLSS